MSLFYIGPNPTSDLCVCAIENEILKVLVVRRSLDSPAEGGKIALPGGFVDSSSKRGEAWVEDIETPIQCAIREACEETGARIELERLKFVGIYEGKMRDPRETELSWTKSHAYALLLDEGVALPKTTPGDDAVEAYFETVQKALEDGMAFDHKKILIKALDVLGFELKDGKYESKERVMQSPDGTKRDSKPSLI